MRAATTPHVILCGRTERSSATACSSTGEAACFTVSGLGTCQKVQRSIADESPSSRDVGKASSTEAIRCLKQQVSGLTLLLRTVLFDSWAILARSFLWVHIVRSSEACSACSSHRELRSKISVDDVFMRRG